MTKSLSITRGTTTTTETHTVCATTCNSGEKFYDNNVNTVSSTNELRCNANCPPTDTDNTTNLSGLTTLAFLKKRNKTGSSPLDTLDECKPACDYAFIRGTSDKNNQCTESLTQTLCNQHSKKRRWVTFLSASRYECVDNCEALELTFTNTQNDTGCTSVCPPVANTVSSVDINYANSLLVYKEDNICKAVCDSLLYANEGPGELICRDDCLTTAYNKRHVNGGNNSQSLCVQTCPQGSTDPKYYYTTSTTEFRCSVDCNTAVGTNNEFYYDTDTSNTLVSRCVSSCTSGEAIVVSTRMCVSACSSTDIRDNQPYATTYSSDSRTATNADVCITDTSSSSNGESGSGGPGRTGGSGGPGSRRYFEFNGSERVLTDNCDSLTRVVEYHTTQFKYECKPIGTACSGSRSYTFVNIHSHIQCAVDCNDVSFSAQLFSSGITGRPFYYTVATSGYSGSLKRCLSACDSTHRAIDLGGTTFECVASCNSSTYFRQLKTILSVSRQICASHCSNTSYLGNTSHGGAQTTRLYYYMSGGERVCTTSCNRIRFLNEDKSVSVVSSGDLLYQNKYEKQETISTTNYVQCVTSTGCSSLYTEELDNEFNAVKSFICVAKCSDSGEHSYRFGNKGVSTPVVEYCVKSCTT